MLIGPRVGFVGPDLYARCCGLSKSANRQPNYCFAEFPAEFGGRPRLLTGSNALRHVAIWVRDTLFWVPHSRSPNVPSFVFSRGGVSPRRRNSATRRL